MSDPAEEIAAFFSALWNVIITSDRDVVAAFFVSFWVILILAVGKLDDMNLWYQLNLLLEYFVVAPSVPLIDVPMTAAEMKDDGKDHPDEKKAADGKINLNDPARPGYIQCYDPSTFQYLGEVKAMDENDVNECCVKAAAAQKKWCQTSFKQRRMVLRTIQKYICYHVEDICRVASRDSGKPKVDALLGEVITTCEKIRTINANGELWLRNSYRSTGPMMVHKIAYVQYVPMGIIAPIAPWNYPFHNMLNHIISGIFAGNAVVGKVSEHTSWSSANYFTKIVQKALEVNGHDPELVQCITGYGNAGAALISNPLVDKVIFTGSPQIGKKVMETASKFLKPVILELGGKDPMVITEDVNIDSVIPWVLRGCYQNCGQNCVGVERVFVYDSIYDQFIDTVLPKVKELRQGIPLQCPGADVDCASMVMDQQCDLIQELVDDAVKNGARLLVGGKRNPSYVGKGQFYEPTIVADVTPSMRLFQEEVFGPVMTIIKVPNNSDEKCVEMINNCKFGLGSSVYCNNDERGLKQIGEKIKSGMCTINDFASNYLVQSLPFGGCKDSGFGRFAGIEGLQALCYERSIVVDRFAWLGVRTTIPPPINYPINKDKGLPFGNALIQLFYNECWFDKLKEGILGLIQYGS